MDSNEISVAAGAITVAIWLYLLLARGQFWRISQVIAPDSKGDIAANIVAVIPARDEADVIGASLESLLASPNSQLQQIFLVNDGSSDGTSQVAEQTAAKLRQQQRLTVIQSAPLPPGWTGKLWAMHQGIEQARALASEFLLLTDADVVHAPGSLAALVHIAREKSFDMVSLMVRLRCETLAEKLLIPAFVFFFFKLYPPKWSASPRSRSAGAAGGCILIRPEALNKAGGIEAICGEIIDDCALARAVKQSGGKIRLGLAPKSYSNRVYSSFDEIGRMISRTAFNQLQHSSLMLLAAILGMIATYLLPLVLLASPGLIAKISGAFALAAMIFAYLPMVQFYKRNPLWSLTLPLAAVFYTGATVHSAIDYWRGRGGTWKGRHQDRGGTATA